jgi:hypothetical protein
MGSKVLFVTLFDYIAGAFVSFKLAFDFVHVIHGLRPSVDPRDEINATCEFATIVVVLNIFIPYYLIARHFV